jgi:FkbM family methyltransferase
MESWDSSGSILRLPHREWGDLRLSIRHHPSSDLRVLDSVFGEEAQYGPLIGLIGSRGDQDSIRTVMDGGAYTGLTAVLFRRAFPGSAILCVEPDDSNLLHLTRNLSLNGIEGVEVEKAGLWGRAGRLETVKGFRDGREWATAVREAPPATGIPALTVEGAMRSRGWRILDVLKLDIEGGEAEVFSDRDAAARFLSATRYLAIEIHDEMCDRAALMDLFRSCGFETSDHGEVTYGRNRSEVRPLPGS